VPKAGSAVIAANHQSMMDIPLLVIASPRRIHFLAKDVIHKGPISTRFFVELGGYPLRRDGVDARAMHVALRILERGDVVGIYPEGTRNKTPQLLTFMGGAAWLAVRTGAPIVPCGMVGTGLWNDDASATVLSTIRRRRVRIVFGPAIAVKRELSPVRSAALAQRGEKLAAMTPRPFPSMATTRTNGNMVGADGIFGDASMPGHNTSVSRDSMASDS
jgi:1-acyl-sn-glycerol-3-phosphate acyltransferase